MANDSDESTPSSLASLQGVQNWLMTMVTSGTLPQINATASSSDVSAALAMAELATDQKTMAENLVTASLDRMVRLKGKWKNCMPKLELLK